MRLTNESRQEPLVEDLEIADTEWKRFRGLLGRASLPPDRALWITRCNSVHTFFMKFSIDLIFLNKAMVVVKMVNQVPPWRLVLPVWRATSVIELGGGSLPHHPVSVGDKLNVAAAAVRGGRD
jgi:uncharacterized protein